MDPIFHGQTDTAVNTAGSSLTLGDKITRTQQQRGKLDVMQRLANFYPRGSFGAGVYAGYRVLQATVTEERGGIGVLSIQWEVNPDFGGEMATFLPPEDFELKPFEINPPVHQHPHFSGIPFTLLDVANQAASGADQQTRDSAWVRLVAGAAIPEANVPEALELATLLRQGVQTYYLTGIEYSWWSYYWGFPACSVGGVIETPGGPGAGLLPSGCSWLRLTDVPTRENGYYKLTRTWKGAPNGHWNTILYS